MPTYHYECKHCQLDFYITRSIKEDPLSECPDCGASGLEQVYHAVSILDMTPRTVGGQADHNYAHAGAYEREARLKALEDARKPPRMDPELMPEGAMPIPDKERTPTWWRPTRTEANPKLVRSDPATKKKYLEKGIL